MARASRKRAQHTASGRATAPDKLSSLPDDVILRIMSCMNARQAVQTCVLSSRWRNLWRSLPRINAEFFEFDNTGIVGIEILSEDELRFKRFVNRLLELRDPVPLMDEFWLRYPRSDEDDIQTPSAEVNRWISHAIQKKARSIELVAMMLPLEVDHTMFTSCYLKKLGFYNVNLTQGFFKQLEKGCPALEDLYLDDCSITDDEISSETIKVLTINLSDLSDLSKDYRTSISAPRVTSLTLFYHEGNFPLLIKDMPFLVTATVGLHDNNVQFDANDMRQFLRSLSAVKELEFDYQGRQMTIENNLQLCPKFINLANLTLGRWCLDANFYALVVFLQNSPRLEKLTLKLSVSPEGTPERIIGELKERSFSCEHLKIVEVICSEDDPLVNCVEDFFVKSGMTSVQIDIKHLSEFQPEPAIFHYE